MDKNNMNDEQKETILHSSKSDKEQKSKKNSLFFKMFFIFIIIMVIGFITFQTLSPFYDIAPDAFQQKSDSLLMINSFNFLNLGGDL